MIIDRKVKFRVGPRVNIALKHLREHLDSILATQMRGRPLTESQSRWNDLALAILRHIKMEGDEEEPKQPTMTLVAGG